MSTEISYWAMSYINRNINISYHRKSKTDRLMNIKTMAYQRYGNFIINKSEALGSGNFGHVWKGYLITKNNHLELVAIKQSYNETQNIKQIQALQILNHPNIIRYRDYRISGNTVFMVMELCQGGTLDDLLYRICMQGYDNATYVEKIIDYYSQIIEGIKFMYDKKIIHRDIKPSNILVNKYNVIKIADFGTSKMGGSSQTKLKTLVGTPLFFSPELFEMSFGQQDTYTQKSQIWALGLILYFMFNYQYTIVKPTERMKQSLPWTGRNTAQIFKNIKTQALKFRKQTEIPQGIKVIITKMLQIDAESRMSFQELFSLQIFQKQTSTDMLTAPELDESEEPIQSQRTININETKRQIIDFQLQQLLERKDQEIVQDQQKQELRQFYELLIKQLQDYYQLAQSTSHQFEENNEQELMFQLEFTYYQITDNIDEKNRIHAKYTNSTQKMKKNEQKCARFKQLDKKCQNRFGMQNIQENPSFFNINKSNLASTSKLQLDILSPNQHLLTKAKSFISNQQKNIYDIKNNAESKLKSKTSKNNFTEMQRRLINLVYDLFTLITFQKSWQIKKKTRATMSSFKKMRKFIKNETILFRISKAYQCVNT